LDDASPQSAPTRGSRSTARRGIGPYARFGKRALDVTLTVLSLPVAAPVVAVTWALTRAEGGPGFFLQQRVGRDGRVFNCWKLRTMRVGAEELLQELTRSDPRIAEEWEKNQKLAEDPRITRLGKFLRQSSLDELPQLWNMLRGDMSLVGPRPFTVDQTESYCDGGGQAYFALRPGITGPWQVDGRGTTAFLDRIRYDNAYSSKLSLKEDLHWLVRTVRVVFRGTGT